MIGFAHATFKKKNYGKYFQEYFIYAASELKMVLKKLIIKSMWTFTITIIIVVLIDTLGYIIRVTTSKTFKNSHYRHIPFLWLFWAE